MVKKIIFGLILLISFFLVYRIADGLKEHNDDYVMVKTIDFKVIDRLSYLRAAQRGYVDVHGKYANNWSELLRFLKEDKFPIIQIKEDILKNKAGKDSISITIDTLEMVPVYDSLKNQLGNTPLLKLDELVVTPVKNDTFLLKTKAKGENYIEVKDPSPINPARQKGGNMKPLKFGSTRSATTKGNWE